MNANPYLVGRVARLIDGHVERLTPGCVGNLGRLPEKWRVFLRHVLPRARQAPETAELVAQLESAPWTPDGSFWLGYYHTPAARLRRELAARGLTQAQAAEKIGVSQPYLSAVLAGRREPTLNWLHAAAVAIGIDPAELDERLAGVR